MKLYISKKTKQNEFRLLNEVIISCDIDELRDLASFFADMYNSLSKIDTKGLTPHSHYKDYLKKGDLNIPDIIVVLKENETI